MTTDVERLLIRLEVTQRKFEKQLSTANRSAARTAKGIEGTFQRMNKRVTASLGGVGRSLQNLVLIGGSGLGAREVVQYADAWTIAGNKIAAASEISGTAARSLERINDIADSTRSGITETADLYAKLLRATAGVAESELEVARATEIVNKAFKAGGAAASEQAAGILQLAQGLSSGILQGDELRSIRENAPLVAQALAVEFETTIGGLKELGAQGELTSERVFRAILNGAGPIEAAFAQTNTTIAESFTKLRNAITEYVGNANEASGTTEKIAKALEGLANNIDVAVAAGIALGSRFIGPILLTQMSRAVPAILAAAGALRGLGVGAGSAAAGLGLVRGVLGVFGGPVGLAITTLTALPLILEDSSDRVADLDRTTGNALSSLNDYATASRNAAREQEELGGKVGAATQQILNQSRAQLQDSLRGLREEYADLKAELEDGLIFNSDTTSLAQTFETAGASNPVLVSLAEQLKAIGDGAGDVSLVSAEMERLAGIGEVAAQRVEQFDLALGNASAVDFTGARDNLISMAETVGGFGDELAAIEGAQSFEEQATAAISLRDAIADAVQAGSALRTENALAVREQVRGAADAEAAIEAVRVALEGNTEEALRIASSISSAANAGVALDNTNMSSGITAAANEAGRLLGNLAAASEYSPEVNAGIIRRGIASGALPPEAAADIPETGADRARAVASEAARARSRAQAASQAASVGSGGGSGGSGGGGAAIADPIIAFNEQLAQSDTALRRQLDSVGKSNAALSGMRAEYDLLEFAKQENLDLDRQIPGTSQSVREAISAQAAEVARLTELYDNNKLATQQVEGALDDIASSLSDSLTQGKSLREGLRSVFLSIANDILTSGIRQALTSVFDTSGIGGGSGGGILGAISGIFGGFRERGGPVRAGTSYVVGEKGPEVFTPSANGFITPNDSIPQSTSGSAIMQGAQVQLDIFVKDDGKIGAIATQAGAAVAVRVTEQNNATIPAMVAEAQARA